MLIGNVQTAASVALSAGSIIEMISNSAIAFSSLVVAILAILGLDVWKKRAKFEVARKMLQFAKKFANEIQRSRNPMGSGDEFSDRPKHDEETAAEAQALDTRYMHMRRLEPAATTIRDLQEASWEVEVAIKIDLSKHLQRFIHVHNEITMAIEKRYSLSKGLEVTPEEHKEMLSTIYALGTPTDSISTQLSVAIEKLGIALKKYI